MVTTTGRGGGSCAIICRDAENRKITSNTFRIDLILPKPVLVKTLITV
jgi:hypothetical protein